MLLRARAVRHLTARHISQSVLAPQHPVSSSRRRAVRVECKRIVKQRQPREARRQGRGFAPQPAEEPEVEEYSDEVKELPRVYQVYTEPNFLPERRLGPVEVKQTDDGSRGVVLTENVMLGQLLAVSTPIVYLEGEFGEAPDIEDLQVYLLEEGLTPGQRQLLDLVSPQPSLGAERAAGVPLAALDPSGSFAERQRQLLGGAPAPELESGRLLDIIQTCSFSEEFQDPAAMQLRHQPPTGYIGVWPEFALMRHSCAPNVGVTVVKDRLLLHATDTLDAGEQLTTNKLGAYITAPLKERRAQMQEAYGLQCSCRRCTAEEQLPAEVLELLEELHALATDGWVTSFTGGMTNEDAEALASLKEEISDAIGELEESLVGVESLSDESRLWVQASAWSSYEMLRQLEEILSGEGADPGVTRIYLELLKVFGKGSDSHTLVASGYVDALNVRCQAFMKEMQKLQAAGGGRYISKQRRAQRQAQQLLEQNQEAEALLLEAMWSRYGYIPEELIGNLREAQKLFYQGLQELSMDAAAGDGSTTAEPRPSRSREMDINGVKVTVVDTVGISAPSQRVVAVEDEEEAGSGSSGGFLFAEASGSDDEENSGDRYMDNDDDVIDVTPEPPSSTARGAGRSGVARAGGSNHGRQASISARWGLLGGSWAAGMLGAAACRSLSQQRQHMATCHGGAFSRDLTASQT